MYHKTMNAKMWALFFWFRIKIIGAFFAYKEFVFHEMLGRLWDINMLLGNDRKINSYIRDI
jgi:hypothetical protein